MHAERGRLRRARAPGQPGAGLPRDPRRPRDAGLGVPQDRRAAAYAFLLESVEGGEKWARYSFLGTEPRRVFVGARHGGRRSAGRAVPSAPSGRRSARGAARLLAAYRPVTVRGPAALLRRRRRLPRLRHRCASSSACRRRCPTTSAPRALFHARRRACSSSTTSRRRSRSSSTSTFVDRAHRPRARLRRGGARASTSWSRAWNRRCGCRRRVPAPRRPAGALQPRAPPTYEAIVRARQGVHPRRRRHPGRAGAALRVRRCAPRPFNVYRACAP